MSARVGLFFGGAQKGGTSTLHAYLAAHPQMSPPAQKELHVFDDEGINWDAPDYAALHGAFAAGDAGRIRYDATPIYGFWPGSLARIQRYNPYARLIWILRDPVERAWSHWRMERARGWEDLDFSIAIRDGRRRLWGGDLTALRRWSYVERGFYAAQILRALALFPRENLLFLTTIRLALDPVNTLSRVAAFLNIAPFADGAPIHAHVGPDLGAPPPDDVAYLRAIWADDMARLQRITGIDVSAWGYAPVPA
ncbi:sulfotransferase [Novosphingobium sp. FSY-8]|uniref:Sulfotransferase n=1 Tax=Novosphingobium ovatum TaxID=1908523 RepID=A0ABW9XAT0_9SPHN|nr:sulfotransferase [Novosphingobium ovatum]NBC35637.1 sulfotransferase [Novosphingobium ovatum]